MESEIEEILRIYAEACDEEVARIEECLLELERNPAETELLHEAFRLTHTIKGDSRTVGFNAPNQIAHLIEDAFDRVRSGAWDVSPGLVSGLLESVDLLGRVIQAALDGDEPREAELETLVAKTRQRLGLSADVDPEASSEARPEESAEAIEAAQAESESTHVPESNEFAGRRSGSLRIRIEVLDRMLDLTGELAIARSRISRLISDADRLSPAELREAHRDVDLLFDEMQEEVMRARMVPIGPIFRQHKRTVRDLAMSDGKHARIEIRGAEAELDTTVIEHVRDCLGHVLRNAIAHGIERPEERVAAGKEPYGRIELAARHEGGSIVVEVTDDGAGLDLERILERARALGMVAPDEEPSQEEIAQFIYTPGFSTRDGASLTSGRGVGMDVVREGIESLGGSVRVQSRRGEGCSVALRLPLTLAIIDGFEVAAGSETFVIPLASVVECVDMRGVEHDRNTTSGIINLRGRPLPYARLRRILGIGGELPSRESVVVVRDGESEAGVVVDSLLGESQAVIKPLGKVFRGVPGIAGSTILADGKVALILDAPALLRSALRRRQLTDTTSPAAAAPC